MNKTTIKTIKQFKDGIDAAFETQQARDRISSIEAVRRSFVSRLIAASRGSRPLALLALLGRPLTRANLGRSRRARANLENLDERGTFAARSRSASNASGLEQLELPRIAALHSALPPTLANRPGAALLPRTTGQRWPAPWSNACGANSATTTRASPAPTSGARSGRPPRFRDAHFSTR